MQAYTFSDEDGWHRFVERHGAACVRVESGRHVRYLDTANMDIFRSGKRFIMDDDGMMALFDIGGDDATPIVSGTYTDVQDVIQTIVTDDFGATFGRDIFSVFTVVAPVYVTTFKFSDGIQAVIVGATAQLHPVVLLPPTYDAAAIGAGAEACNFPHIDCMLASGDNTGAVADIPFAQSRAWPEWPAALMKLHDAMFAAGGEGPIVDALTRAVRDYKAARSAIISALMQELDQCAPCVHSRNTQRALIDVMDAFGADSTADPSDHVGVVCNKVEELDVNHGDAYTLLVDKRQQE